MEKYSFDKCFNARMSSAQALHVYVKLAKSVPIEQREALGQSYDKFADIILRRECENVKKGWMY